MGPSGIAVPVKDQEMEVPATMNDRDILLWKSAFLASAHRANLAGFDLVEPEPLNFFTTGRPPSGIRIGFKNESSEPPQVATLLKGFRAIGFDPPLTTLVNSDSDDVVEIQVTPRQ